MLRITNLIKKYDRITVLKITDLVIGSGELVGLVGNNGAGKTTLFRLLLDLICSDGGEILSGKYDVAKSENWKEYTGSYLDEGFLIDFLTPEEFFYFIGSIYGINRQMIDQKLASFNSFFNGEILDQPKKYIRDFSTGNKQKIGVVSTLITDPQVIILDEPFNSLDPSAQMHLKKILSEYNNNTGATILISSHNLVHVTDICTRIILLEKGQIIRDIKNDGSALHELNEYFSGEELSS
jgi:ABC-2 type transport system ATP-binding protein